MHCILFSNWLQQWQIRGGGGGGGAESAVAPPPPIFRPFFGLVFFFAFHPGGRFGRRTVPLHQNINDATKKFRRKQNLVEFPPTAERLLQASAFGFPALPFHKSWIRHWLQATLITNACSNSPS